MTDQEFKQIADEIWTVIQKSQNILLHFHPSPDPDSVGSALSMSKVAESLGKKVTVIQGDTPLLPGLDVIPGSEKILKKNYLELDLKNYDLFIVQDTSDLEMITAKGPVKFPEHLKTVVIDHHVSNKLFGQINLVVSSSPATCQILYNLFEYWKINITEDIATCLMLGIYSDTGGFRFEGTTEETFLIGAKLARFTPNYHKYLFKMDNAMQSKQIELLGLGFSSVKVYGSRNIAVSEISNNMLIKKNITSYEVNSIRRMISSQLIAVTNWEIGIAFIEIEPNLVTLSLRSRDSEKYNVSKIAVAIGGGGHPAASGASIKMPFEEARQFLLDTIYSVYPDLKS